jgi:hypothetical protein
MVQRDHKELSPAYMLKTLSFFHHNNGYPNLGSGNPTERGRLATLVVA